MKILILGGTHLVGSWLVKLLCRLGHTVTIFNRDQTSASLSPNVNRLYGDRRQLANYFSLWQGL